MVNGELSPEFAHPVAIGAMEIGSIVVWIVMFLYCWRQSKRAGELSLDMLLLLSFSSMFWQEFYVDWAGYLLYNPAFTLLPWGSTLWTTQHKPAFMFFSYGWFYYGVVLIMLALVAKFKARNPGWGHVASVFVVAFPIFYLWDFILESYASFTGWWVYVYHMGPTIALAKGNYPYVHPIGVYAVTGAILCLAMSYRRADGHIWFESHFRVDRFSPGFPREAARLGAWCIFQNLLYLLSFTMPMVLVRLALNIPNAVVP